jgi:hypothetical protein
MQNPAETRNFHDPAVVASPQGDLSSERQGALPIPPSLKPSPNPGILPVANSQVEIGGPPGPEPTRYGDWERKGRCIDF